MKHNGLEIYLHDHLAGATVAINLLKSLSRKHPDEEVGRFAASLLVDIEADHAVLKILSSRIEKRSAGFKEMVARFFEKLSRPKFHWNDQNSFGEFEALEMLTLGITGKESLWTALATITDVDPRVTGFDYATLTARAREQRERVNQRRLQIAPLALAANASS